MKSPLLRFLVRWIVCAFGLWLSAELLSSRVNINDQFSVILIAGLVLAIINVVIRPVLVIMTLPAIVLSLGLFMVVVNGLTVLLASKLYHPLHVTNFWAAMLAGMVIGLINYIVTNLWRRYEHL